jgi:hypothetical protein
MQRVGCELNGKSRWSWCRESEEGVPRSEVKASEQPIVTIAVTTTTAGFTGWQDITDRISDESYKIENNATIHAASTFCLRSQIMAPGLPIGAGLHQARS